jgi:general secretion pathway protein G
MSRHSTSSLVASARTRRRHLSRAADERGLTLVEIMVVIAILGMLMSVVAVNVMGSLQEANVDATKLTIKKVEQGIQMYATKHKGKYPSTSQGLEAAAKYYPDNKVPTDAWGGEFQYYSPGTSGDRDYEIISLGKDGQEGGEDVDADIKSWEAEISEED